MPATGIVCTNVCNTKVFFVKNRKIVSKKIWGVKKIPYFA